MKLISKIILCVLIYLAFMLALFPARLAVSLAPLPSNLQLGGVSGTIWSGSIDVIKLQQRQLEQLSWDLSPWALLTGKAKLDFQLGSRASAVSAKGQLTLAAGGISAEKLRFEAPAEFLLASSRLPFRTQVSGEVSVLLDTLAQGQPWCEALSGKVFLNRVGIKNQFGQYPLGDIELGLQCVAGQVQLATDEEKNAIGVAGTLLLKANEQLEVKARIRETQAQSEDLKKALPFLGKRNPQGYFPINYNGKIPGL
ncbi:type II secretion system protein N [Shewanella chilikensis]|uniref:type II secretion system protein N n=1 Tax=Shewanella chilikensis TaxID=558541 RepID=UPI00300666FC